MKGEYFVRVLRGPGRARPWGTGYLIARDRVLTAAHVVGNAKSVTIEYDAEGKAEVLTTSAEVAWRGRGACDVALLRLAETVAFTVVPPRLGDAPLAEETRWRSRGWARVAADKPRVRDSMVDLAGKAAPFLVDQERQQLGVDEVPVDPDMWHGVSGAPVFDLRSRVHLLGVITEAPMAFHNVLEATPLTLAFKQGGEEFLAAIGSEVAHRRLERLEADLVRLLARNDGLAAKAIVEQRESWRQRFVDGGASGLADALLDSDAGDVLVELVKAHSQLGRTRGAEPEASAAIEAVVARIAPLLVQRGYLSALPPSRSGGVLLQLPVATKTVAELVLAGFDGRPSRFSPVPGGFPAGVYRLPLPVAEEGLDIAGGDRLESYAKHLETAFLSTDEQRHAARLRATKPDGQRLAREWILQQVDGLFELQADLAEWPARRYLLYDSDFARDNDGFLRQLAARMRSIHRVEMTETDPAGESRICRLLQRLVDQGGRTDDEES